MLIETKAIIATPNVTTIWLVTVKLYGIIPSKLQKKIKENIVNNIGKKYDPFFLTFSLRSVKKMKSYRYSNNVCVACGTSLAL